MSTQCLKGVQTSEIKGGSGKNNGSAVYSEYTEHVRLSAGYGRLRISADRRSDNRMRVPCFSMHIILNALRQMRASVRVFTKCERKVCFGEFSFRK